MSRQHTAKCSELLRTERKPSQRPQDRSGRNVSRCGGAAPNRNGAPCPAGIQASSASPSFFSTSAIA